jgi:hypothetical protein
VVLQTVLVVRSVSLLVLVQVRVVSQLPSLPALALQLQVDLLLSKLSTQDQQV